MKKNGKQNILIISYNFIPLNSVAVQRVLSMANYLVKHDNNCTVLAASPNSYDKTDYSYQRNCDNRINVYRISDVLWFSKYIFAGKLLYYSGNNLIKKILKNLQRLLFKLEHTVKNKLYILDRHLLWGIKLFCLLLCAPLARQIVKNCDYIIVSGPPFLPLLFVAAASRLWKKKFIIDCRDPWLNSLGEDCSGIRYKLRRYVEKIVVRRAFAVSNTFSYDYFLHYGASRGKIYLLYNGYTEDNHPSRNRIFTEDMSSYVNIGYAGSFYGDYNPEIFLQFLLWLQEEDPVLFSRIYLHFAGNINIKEKNMDAILSLPVKVKNYGYLENRYIDYFNSKMDLLLLFCPKVDLEFTYNEYYAPTKYFSYLKYGKPVLSMTPRFKYVDDFNRQKLGLFVDVDRFDENESAYFKEIYDFIVAVKDGYQVNLDEKYKSAFSRNVLTENYFSWLETKFDKR